MAANKHKQSKSSPQTLAQAQAPTQAPTQAAPQITVTSDQSLLYWTGAPFTVHPYETATVPHYDLAEAYDKSFQREYTIEQEVNGLLTIYDLHSTNRGGEQFNVSELCCGPARHAREFQRLGWHAAGIDLSENMLAYAERLNEKEGVPLALVRNDIRDLQIPSGEDLIFNPWVGITHLLTNDDILRCLRSVASRLRSGGLFVFSIINPVCPWTREGYTETYDEATLDDGTKVTSVEQYLPEETDWLAETVVRRLSYTFTDPSGVSRTVLTKMTQRQASLQCWLALIELSGCYSDVWTYGSLALPLPPPLNSNQVAVELYLVLRRS